MTEPAIASRSPCLLDLPPGDYFWCACGLSKNQPFCDGSHKGTGITPVKFTIAPGASARTVWLCCCKRSSNKPFCDGTHNTLPREP